MDRRMSSCFTGRPFPNKLIFMKEKNVFSVFLKCCLLPGLGPVKIISLEEENIFHLIFLLWPLWETGFVSNKVQGLDFFFFFTILIKL